MDFKYFCLETTYESIFHGFDALENSIDCWLRMADEIRIICNMNPVSEIEWHAYSDPGLEIVSPIEVHEDNASAGLGFTSNRSFPPKMTPNLSLGK